MYESLTEHIKQAAYFQWEVIDCPGALELWHCVEEIVNFMERRNILSEEALMQVLKNANPALVYEDFVRELAYRISFYSVSRDAVANWYATEGLLHNSEWRRAIVQAARIYAAKKNEHEFLNQIRSDRVREYYANADK